MLSRFFGSRQVRDCEKALDLLQPLFEGVIAYSLLESQVRTMLRKHPKQVEQKMLIEGESAQQVVLQLIGGIAFGECESGKYHTYRGVLSTMGHGFRQCVGVVHQRLIELGTLDPDDAKAIQSDLTQAIKDAG